MASSLLLPWMLCTGVKLGPTRWFFGSLCDIVTGDRFEQTKFAPYSSFNLNDLRAPLICLEVARSIVCWLIILRSWGDLRVCEAIKLSDMGIGISLMVH